MAEYKNITLKEVAKHAGVSAATVSRVLNDMNNVHPETAKNVEEAIRYLGYYRNSIARSLKTNSTNTIAFITANISNPYMITVAKAIEDMIHNEKYNLLMCSTEGDPERELEQLKIQMGRNIDGLVLNATGFNGEFIASISRQIPVVLVHRRYYLEDFIGDSVDSDDEEGTYNLTKHLTSFGHKRIFVIKGTKHTSSNINRFRGFCKAMSEIGIFIDDDYPYQYDGNFNEESGYNAVLYLYTLPVRPTAVLGFNNLMTIGAMRGLIAHNISIPEEISVASYNNIDFKELMLIRPTVHYIDPREIGLLAGKALLERIKEKSIPNRALVLNGQLIPGNAVSVANDYISSQKIGAM